MSCSRQFLQLVSLLTLVHLFSAMPLLIEDDEKTETKEGSKPIKDDTSAADHSKEETDNDLVMFEGDIIMTQGELKEMRASRSKRNAGSGLGEIMPVHVVIGELWPGCRVPFKFGQNLNSPARRSFMKAIELWEQHTCIQFEHARISDRDYLDLQYSYSCRSFVGRRGGGGQVVSLAPGCSEVGHAVHELGHAIGLWHEHSRPDRDNYINVHRENLENDDDWSNFAVLREEQFKQVPDVGYDIQSIMHYSPYAFSGYADRYPTITIREDADLPELRCSNRLWMGQRERLSFKDKKRTSLLYGCDFELEEPECLLPTPSPTMPSEVTKREVETTEMEMPTPTATTPIWTPPPLSNKLKSGNVIALTFDDGSHGMKCELAPGCTPLPCKNRGGNTCENVDNQFQILKQDNRSNRIKNGNTVLLRSVNSPSNWLDCSDQTRCTISSCKEDNVEDAGNSSYLSNCSKHHFQVYGLNRQPSKVLSLNHKLLFGYNSERFLSCKGRQCGLLADGECPQRPSSLSPLPESRYCPKEYIAAIKLSEI